MTTGARLNPFTGELQLLTLTLDAATELTGILPIANGGTASGSALNNNRLMISSSSAIVEATAVTANRALISDANGIPVASSVTNTTLAFLDASSSVQTQLNTKAATFSASQIIRGTADTKGGSSSGDTTCINYSTAISSIGSDITFTARTTTTADFYTINTTGRYAIWATAQSDGPAEIMGISINSTGTSTVIQSLPTTQTPNMGFSSGGNFAEVPVPGINLTAGDIVRVQCENAFVPVTSGVSRFGITRIG